jgi:2-phosphosulfolactate phosphatase
MRIDTYFTVAEVDPASIGDGTVVVIDVVGATTTIIEALANGARAIYPTSTTEEAVKLAASLGREDTLLCGERRGRKIEGFDLGNSPQEFSAEVVHDKKLVMSTSNGTRALTVGQEASRILPCAFTNLGAVAAAVSVDERLVLICAGQNDRFGLDDALCAGHLVQRIMKAEEGRVEYELNDAAQAARALAGFRKPTRKFLGATAGGAALVEIGMGDDLDICADVDRHDIVAEMSDQAIIRSGE